MARIFAKALNGGTDEIDLAIMKGRDSDVIEIDAASNNKVEEARELIANSVYRPMRGKYKIYIIDEVHMLSTAAFNALLKTMEEPPEHVKFILCTTDPHKIPATIQSRCQRFDFKNISTSQIAEHLTSVIKNEKLKAEPELIQEVAKQGQGSMRDALSLLDRLMAAGEKKLTLTLFHELLGLPDRAVISNLLDALANADPASALQQTDTLVRTGLGIEQLLESIIARLRDLMVIAACGPDTTLVDLTGTSREDEAARAARFDAAGLVHMIALCENVQRACKSSTTPRALLDALVVRLALTEKLADITALLTGSNQASAPRGPNPKKS